MYNVTVTTAPTETPVDVKYAKGVMRRTDTFEDVLLASMIKASITRLQKYLNRVFINTVFRIEYDRVNLSGMEAYPFVKIPRSPLVSVASVQTSKNGTFSDENHQIKTQPAYSRILFPDGLPSLDDTPFPLRIDCTAGYGTTPASVPEPIRLAIAMYANYLSSNRGDCSPQQGDGIPTEIKALVNSYKIIDTFGVC